MKRNLPVFTLLFLSAYVLKAQAVMYYPYVEGTTEQEKNVSYDANGNMLSDGTYTYTYDKNNNLSAKIIYNSAGEETSRVNYEYDSNNRKISETKYGANGQKTSSTSYAYDANDRKISETNYGANGQKTSSTSYTYNDDNTVNKKTQYNASGVEISTTEYTYVEGRVDTEHYKPVSGSGEHLYQYTYEFYDDEHTKLKSQDYAEQPICNTVTYGSHSFQSCTMTSNQGMTGCLSHKTTYDINGNITSQACGTHDFTYEDGQIKTDTYTAGNSNIVGTVTYNYENGELVSKVDCQTVSGHEDTCMTITTTNYNRNVPLSSVYSPSLLAEVKYKNRDIRRIYTVQDAVQAAGKKNKVFVKYR